MNKASTQISVLVLQGQLTFGALNADESHRLSALQKATFTGVVDDGEIQQDLLLKGRKIPKGVLSPIESLSDVEKKRYSDEERKRQDMVKKIAAEKKASLVESKNAGLLCHAPQGLLNQCVWRMEKGKCVRRRCTADGLWKDPQDVGVSDCRNKALAQLCDY